MSNSEEGLEKYKELYVLSKEVLVEEQQRFHRVEERASRYFSLLTLIVGVDAFFGNWILENFVPPDSAWKWSLAILGALLFVSTIASWLLVFRIMKIKPLTKMPLDTDTISFFRQNRLLDIYYALAKGNESALRQNRRITEMKFARLQQAHRVILFTVSLLVVFLLVYGGHEWVSGEIAGK